MMHTKVQILVVEYQWERTLLRATLAMLMLLTLGYLYFVTASVLNVIAHREAVAHTTKIESEIGLLEQTYFSVSQTLTPETGSALGLSPITNQKFVYRHGTIGRAGGAQTAI